MKKMNRVIKHAVILVAGASLLFSCSKGNPTSLNPGGASTTTGMAFNEENGFTVNEYAGQPEGPNLVYIEGGRTVLGSFEEDLMKNGDKYKRFSYM